MATRPLQGTLRMARNINPPRLPTRKLLILPVTSKRFPRLSSGIQSRRKQVRMANRPAPMVTARADPPRVRSDQTGRLALPGSRQDDPERLRSVRFFDAARCTSPSSSPTILPFRPPASPPSTHSVGRGSGSSRGEVSRLTESGLGEGPSAAAL